MNYFKSTYPVDYKYAISKLNVCNDTSVLYSQFVIDNLLDFKQILIQCKYWDNKQHWKHLINDGSIKSAVDYINIVVHIKPYDASYDCNRSYQVYKWVKKNRPQDINSGLFTVSLGSLFQYYYYSNKFIKTESTMNLGEAYPYIFIRNKRMIESMIDNVDLVSLDIAIRNLVACQFEPMSRGEILNLVLSKNQLTILKFIHQNHTPSIFQPHIYKEAFCNHAWESCSIDVMDYILSANIGQFTIQPSQLKVLDSTIASSRRGFFNWGPCLPCLPAPADPKLIEKFQHINNHIHLKLLNNQSK